MRIGSSATPFTSVRFADTNIFLYAISRAPEEKERAQVANEILEAGGIGLSVQVLQEFYVQATRESRNDSLSHDQAVRLVKSFMRFPVLEPTSGLVLAAAALRDRFKISYWDAAIVEAARALGCDMVLSEDLSHGQDYSGVLIENPFA